MQVDEVKNEGLKREYTVKVEAAVIATKVEEQLGEIAKEAKIAGFRPGHVPVKIIKQRYGKSVMGEVLEKVVNESSQNVLNDKKLTPAMSPAIEITSYNEGSDLEYKMSVEVMPDVPEFDFSTITLEKQVAEASEDEINASLGRIASSNKTFVTAEADSKADNGDQAVINFVGKVDDVAFEGGSADNVPLELGSGSFIPGFEEQLVGKKANDDVTVKVTFPENYHKKDLANKAAEFAVHIVEIKKAQKSEVNDELAKNLGFQDNAGLREAVVKQLNDSYNDAARMKLKKQLFDAMDEKIDFAVPQCMFDQEFNSIWKNIEQAKTEGDEAVTGKSDDELRSEYTKIATRRVKLGIVLSDLAVKHKLQITKEELTNAIMQQAKNFPGQERFIFDFYTKNPERMQEMHGPIMEEKTVDLIISKAKINERKVTAEEVLKEEEESDSGNTEKQEKKAKKKAANG